MLWQRVDGLYFVEMAAEDCEQIFVTLQTCNLRPDSQNNTCWNAGQSDSSYL